MIRCLLPRLHPSQARRPFRAMRWTPSPADLLQLVHQLTVKICRRSCVNECKTSNQVINLLRLVQCCSSDAALSIMLAGPFVHAVTVDIVLVYVRTGTGNSS